MNAAGRKGDKKNLSSLWWSSVIGSRTPFPWYVVDRSASVHWLQSRFLLSHTEGHKDGSNSWCFACQTEASDFRTCASFMNLERNFEHLIGHQLLVKRYLENYVGFVIEQRTKKIKMGKERMKCCSAKSIVFLCTFASNAKIYNYNMHLNTKSFKKESFYVELLEHKICERIYDFNF